MDAPNFDIIVSRLGAFLQGEVLLVYCGLIGIFILLEMVLQRPAGPRPKAGKRHLVNFALLILGILLVSLVPLGSAAAALLAKEHEWGLFNHISAPLIVVLSVSLLVRTLLAYWLHRILHRVPILWRIHRVHHSDSAIDLSTSLRHHPVEILLSAPLYYGAIMALGLPIWSALLTDALMLAGAFLKHLDARLPDKVERLAGWVLATPSIHRIHHSSRPIETDSNFGNALIIWDRVFGTYRHPSPEGPKRLGLGDAHDPIADDLIWQLRLALNEPPKPAPKPAPELGENSQP